MSFELSRRQNAGLYGPTTGDAVRLGDTDLFAEIERDLTHHGEEAVFGGGKVIRDGMGHNGRAVRALHQAQFNTVIISEWIHLVHLFPISDHPSFPIFQVSLC
mgnify:CR=1 FL=1